MIDNEQYWLFTAAVMTTSSGSLRTTKHLYLGAMEELKKDMEAVPERFRTVVEAFDIKRGCVLPNSSAVDDIWDSLNRNRNGVHGAREMNGGGLWVSRIYLFEGARDAFLAENQFTREELDWLWQFAKKLRDMESPPLHSFR